MSEYEKQANCEHDWEFKEAEEADSFCFAPEMPQRLLCKKCKIELWYTARLPKEDKEVFKQVLAGMGKQVSTKLGYDR